MKKKLVNLLRQTNHHGKFIKKFFIFSINNQRFKKQCHNVNRSSFQSKEDKVFECGNLLKTKILLKKET